MLLSFHVDHGKNFVTDLKPSDVVLLEDGKPRAFTIFDSPATQGRMPLELVLLFDANPAIPSFWDPAGVYRFIPHWTLAMSQQVLAKESADIRVSIYRCSGHRLFRATPATANPRTILTAFRDLLVPEQFPQPAGTVEIPISLPPRRDGVPRGPFTEDYVSSYFVSSEQRGWPMEAAIGVLNDVSAGSEKVARLLVMFSEGIGATTTVPEDIGNHALDLGIPIYPVATNYDHFITRRWPRNLFRMQEFESLGKMTGGRSVEYSAIDAPLLLKILESVKSHGLAEYVVGFAPQSGDGAPREHKLQIKLAVKSSGTLEGGMRRAVY